MKLDCHFYFIFCSCFIISNPCFSESIPALLLKEDVIEKLTAPGDVIGTLINGISKNMNGTVNIPLVVDLMQSEPDWMRSSQKDKSSKNKLRPFKMHSMTNNERHELMTPKTLFDTSLGNKGRNEKDILNDLKESLGIMIKKPSFENRFQTKTGWKTKPAQPKNEKLGEIDVTEPNEYSDDENNDEDDSFGNEKINSLKDLQTLRTPKYTTERNPASKHRHYINKFDTEEGKPFSKNLHNTYYNVQTKSQKLKGQTPFQKKHHDTMLSIDDILQVLDEISTDMKNEKKIYDYKDVEKDNRIEEDGEQQMLLKNLKNYFGLISLKDKLEIDPVDPLILQETNTDSINEEEIDDSDRKMMKLKPQLVNDKSSESTDANDMNSFYKNLTDMLMNPKITGNMNGLLNLIRNIDNYQKSSLNLASILDSQTNLKSNEDIDDCVDGVNQHLHNSARFDDKIAYTSDQEVQENNKQPAQNLGASIKSEKSPEENRRLINDVETVGKQSLTAGNPKVSNDNSKDNQLAQSKEEVRLSPTQCSESSLANNPKSNKNEVSLNEEGIRESPLHDLQQSIRNNENLQRKVGLKDGKSWINGLSSMASK